MASMEWESIAPDEHGDWINQRSESFRTFRPLTAEHPEKSEIPIFLNRTLGLNTNRDAWCYNSSSSKLRGIVQRSVEAYNHDVEEFQKTNVAKLSRERIANAKSFVKNSVASGQFHYTDKNYRDLANGIVYEVEESGFTYGSYRPLFRQRLYFNQKFNHRTGSFSAIYPDPKAENLGIAITREDTPSPFHTLMTDTIIDLHLTGDSVYLPRYWYEPNQAALSESHSARKLRRVSNINPAALSEFREHYANPAITEDDLFYYTYGVLHSQQWRDTFAVDLSKSPARIPMAQTAADFQAFVDAGRELAGLHLNYESVQPYSLEEIHTARFDADSQNAYRVEKMRYAGTRGNDKTRIIYNSSITLAGIPEKAHEYRLGTRSALDWLIDRYQVRTHNASGIINDPNDWADEVGDPRYILNLVKRVTTVSVRTVEIVDSLPELPT